MYVEKKSNWTSEFLEDVDFILNHICQSDKVTALLRQSSPRKWLNRQFVRAVINTLVLFSSLGTDSSSITNII